MNHRLVSWAPAGRCKPPGFRKKAVFGIFQLENNFFWQFCETWVSEIIRMNIIQKMKLPVSVSGILRIDRMFCSGLKNYCRFITIMHPPGKNPAGAHVSVRQVVHSACVSKLQSPIKLLLQNSVQVLTVAMVEHVSTHRPSSCVSAVQSLLATTVK